MADFSPRVNPLFRREEDLRQEIDLLERQQARLARAYRAAAIEAVECFRKVLPGMARDGDRSGLESLPTAWV